MLTFVCGCDRSPMIDLFLINVVSLLWEDIDSPCNEKGSFFMHDFSIWVVTLLIKQMGQAVDDDQKEVYVYGFECMAHTGLISLVLILCGFLLGHPLEVILWLISFSVIRSHMGGFHASTPLLCFFITLTLGLSSLLVCRLFLMFAPLGVLVTASTAILIYLVAPITHPNRPVPESEFPLHKRKAFLSLTALCLLALVLFPFSIQMSAMVMTGVLEGFLMAITALIKKHQCTADSRY